MDTPLNRCLSTWDITMLGIGHMIGAGIYVLTGTVAKEMAGPGIVLSFILAGLVSMVNDFLLFCFTFSSILREFYLFSKSC